MTEPHDTGAPSTGGAVPGNYATPVMSTCRFELLHSVNAVHCTVLRDLHWVLQAAPISHHVLHLDLVNSV